MSKLVSRDPFARLEIYSKRMYGVKDTTYGIGTCKWCGQVKTTPNGRKYLFQYRVVYDGGKKAGITGLFCSISCMRNYNS